MKSLVVNPNTNIPRAPNSHVLGRAALWANLLNAQLVHNMSSPVKIEKELAEQCKVYIDHGANFNGSLNLFGGLTRDIYNNWQELLIMRKCGHKIYSLDIDMPDFGEMFRKRLNAESTYYLFDNSVCNEISDLCRNHIKRADYTNIAYKGITYGDSHSLAFSKKGDYVFKIDGSTLFSQLRKDWVNTFFDKQTHDVTFCFGSIDVRHHILRTGTEIKKLARDYIDKVCEFNCTYDTVAEICAVVPVEYEGRRIPKTGYYDGKPFTGSLESRKHITNEFNNYIEQEYEKFVKPPGYWYTMCPELYAKEYMERGGSVHISPMHYRSKGGWENA